MKKVLCLCISFIMCISLFTFNVFATNDSATTYSVHDMFLQASQQIEEAAIAQGLQIGVPYTYIRSDGQELTYYLDEGYDPYYIDKNGEKILLALPLSHLEVTNTPLADIAMRKELALFESPMLRWEPSSYYDLTNDYVTDFDFSGERILEPPIFKLWKNDPSVCVKTSNFGLFADKKLFIVYTWYDIITGNTRSGMLRGADGMGVDCSISLGQRIQCVSNERFVGFTIGRANEVTTCTVTIYSTHLQT